MRIKINDIITASNETPRFLYNKINMSRGGDSFWRDSVLRGVFDEIDSVEFIGAFLWGLPGGISMWLILFIHYNLGIGCRNVHHFIAPYSPSVVWFEVSSKKNTKNTKTRAKHIPHSKKRTGIRTNLRIQ